MTAIYQTIADALLKIAAILVGLAVCSAILLGVGFYVIAGAALLVVFALETATNWALGPILVGDELVEDDGLNEETGD